MARKLRSNRYYLEEREEEDVKLLVMSEKVRQTELCACAYVYYGPVSCSCLAPLAFGCFVMVTCDVSILRHRRASVLD